VRQALLAPLAILAWLAAAAWAWPQAAPEHMSPRATYLERCGGCHGVDGRAFAATVPDLKGKVGYFLCAPAGRDYVGRLPNIVFSRITDGELAALLNYVVFDLGGESVPKGARAFTPAEAGRLRRRPLSIPDLEGYRARVVLGIVSRCGAPSSLASDYAPILGPREGGSPG
jgi:hypothetical protein